MATPETSSAAPGVDDRPSSDRFYVGRLIDYGRSRHEHHSNGQEAFYVKILEDGGHQRTIWGGGSLQAAFQKSRTQPQLNELVGVRENKIDPTSVVYRARNRDGQVAAERRLETPKPHWVVERLAFFDERAAAAKALRDASLPRRDAVLAHRDLIGAYMVLDEGARHAAETIKTPEGQARYLQLLRETLARTVERAAPLPITEEQIKAKLSERRAEAERTRNPGAARDGHTR